MTLLKMPQPQIDALKQWLMVENVTYPEAVKRLAEQFGVKSSHQKISIFWHRVCCPQLPQVPQTLLGLHLEKSGRGWRISLLQTTKGVEARVQRKRLMPARTINVRDGT
ncbi:MAG TPA: hypothetical protein VH595_22050 [Verrucomicrobiae bacterium]|nr:hypothetical protein [Verrucomicrobiae bacterium]